MGRVFVAGSINMDVVATASRHPRVGETVAGQAVHYFPGGKGANQAVAAAKLGAPVTLIGRLGTDAFGQQLRTFLAAQGVDLTLVKDTADIHTGTAVITIADADNTIVVVPGANALVSAEDVGAPALAKGDVAVSQFEIPQATISAFFKRARAAGRPRSSIRRRRAPAAPSCSISSISSFSTRPSLGFSHRPSFTIPTSPPASLTQRDACQRLQTRSSASRWASAACSR